jgi:hypothetical protein
MCKHLNEVIRRRHGLGSIVLVCQSSKIRNGGSAVPRETNSMQHMPLACMSRFVMACETPVARHLWRRGPVMSKGKNLARDQGWDSVATPRDGPEVANIQRLFSD